MQNKKVVSIIGATLSGNKGASAMLVTAISWLKENVKNKKINVFSYYPKEDTSLNKHFDIGILSATPLYLLFVMVPLSILFRLFGNIGFIKKFLLRNNGLRAVYETDLWIDMAGVSFMDGREKYLPYNILCIFSPIMLKKKILKYSQALGPFNGIFNKLLSKIFLPKISTIIARGNVTYNYLKELGLRNIILGADSAFLLPVSNVNLSVELVKGFIGISPSGVVATKKKDYADIMADFIKYLINKGKKIVLIPHSVRFGSKRAKNNDILVCSYINEMVSNESCIFLNKDLSSKELRILIGSLDFHVTSRFHAMISSLERGVPTIVIGWSHKYKEVMEMFEVTDYCLDYKELTFDLLKTKFEKLMQSRTFIAKKLTDNLLKVKLSSDVNFEQIKKLLDL